MGNARSLVCAADIYASAFAQAPLSPDAGKRYRYMVLQPGSGQSEAETIEEFLGRKPNSQAYFDCLTHQLLRN